MFTRQTVLLTLSEASIEDLFNTFDELKTEDLEKILTTVNFILLDRENRDG